MAGVLVLVQYAILGDPAAFWADALNEFVTHRLEDETQRPCRTSPAGRGGCRMDGRWWPRNLKLLFGSVISLCPGALLARR